MYVVHAPCVSFPITEHTHPHPTITRIVFESETWQTQHINESTLPRNFVQLSGEMKQKRFHSRRCIRPLLHSGVFYQLHELLQCPQHIVEQCCMVDSSDLLGLGRYAVVRPGHRFGYVRALSGMIFLSALMCVCLGEGLF